MVPRPLIADDLRVSIKCRHRTNEVIYLRGGRIMIAFVVEGLSFLRVDATALPEEWLTEKELITARALKQINSRMQELFKSVAHYGKDGK